MQVKIPSPKHYESYYGSSDLVRAYLDQIEKEIEHSFACEAIDTLRISLLIASPEELSQGLFLAYERFDWRCGYAAVGVNGNYEQYHLGDDLDKIRELSEMLQAAFILVGKKRKAKLDSKLANEIVVRITHSFTDSVSKNVN